MTGPRTEGSAAASESLRAKREVVGFVLLTFALSSVFYYLMASAGSIEGEAAAWVPALMWSPGVAALIVHLIGRRTLRGLGWGWGASRYQLASYALPLGYAAVAYGLVWASGLGRFGDPDYTARLVEGFWRRRGAVAEAAAEA